MQFPGRIREHRQAVVLGFAGVFDGTGGAGLVPVLLGGMFDIGGGVFVLHERQSAEIWKTADYTRVYTINEYMTREINPMLDLMNFYGLKVSSFAYPYGGRTKKLDAALLKKFKIIRGRAFREEIADKQGCYFSYSNLIFSFSIDDTHNDFTIPHLLQLLNFAKKHNKILILNSHKTVNNVTGDYQTKNETLEYVCKYIKNNKMKFYTVSDLEKIQ